MTTETSTPKTKIGKILQGKFVKKFLAPILRATIKIGLPVIGTPIVEIATNLMQPKTTSLPLVGSDANVEVEKPKKHSWVSIAIQIVLGISIIYAFYTKMITVEDLIRLINQVFGAQ